MRHAHQEGFLLQGSSIRREILIPRYYDPRIGERLEDLAEGNNFVSIDELVAAGHLQHDHGSYVPKIYYGTGPYPYIRTSDLANWEIKASPKHGVPENVYEQYAAKQDVQPKDILLVHEGTYLIGSVAMVTVFDGPLLYQHHLAKFRINPSSSFNAYFLLAAFETEIVQQQFRSKQFSADIIDSIVGRVGEIVIPFPKDANKLRDIEGRIERIVLGRAEIRERISHITHELDEWLRGETTESLDQIFAWKPSPEIYQGKPAFLGGRKGFLAFSQRASDIKNDVLLPKYYDPSIAELGSQHQSMCDLMSIDDLVNQELIRLDTGDEIGRLSYGTGSIPFVRTSDFGSWELKQESKQGVSQEVLDTWGAKQDIQPNDILLVRDGTYLVGTSVLIQEEDRPLLYCGGIIKIRCLRPDVFHPALLFALLNTPFARRQMRNKQFTRDVIDTLGRRFGEVLLPIPRSESTKTSIATHLEELLHQRRHLRTELSEVMKTMF